MKNRKNTNKFAKSDKFIKFSLRKTHHNLNLFNNWLASYVSLNL